MTRTTLIPNDGTKRRRKRRDPAIRALRPGDRLEYLLRTHGIGGWQREYRFHAERRWKFDFAFLEQYLPGGVFRLAIEIEGISGMRPKACARCGTVAMIPAVSGHQTARGMREDIEKYNAALRLHWIVCRITQHDVDSAETLDLIRQFVGTGGAMPPAQKPIDLEAAFEAPF